MKTKKHNKSHRGNASQFFVAGELCRRGYAAVVTMGNCPNTDILCSNEEGTKFVHIQVKTFRPGDNSCSVGQKAEKEYGPNFFWVLAGIPTMDTEQEFSYYIIPSDVMAKNIKEGHRIWERTPGLNNKQHSLDNKFRGILLPPRNNLNWWNVSQYKNRWDLIEKKLK